MERISRRPAALLASLALVVAGLAVPATPVHATGAVINVPADQPTIQAAVAASASGDTILIAPGTYTGGVWVQDKVLTFASWYTTTGDPSYIDRTVVSGYVANACGGASGCAGNAVLEFGSRSGGSAVQGLTIENGVDGVRGNAAVTVSHSTMTANGDGVDFGNDSTGHFDHDVFLANTDDGIDINGRVAMTLLDSTIQQNQGDGIEFRMYPYVGPQLDVVIQRNRFVRNDSDGIQLIDSDGASSRTVTIDRNIFDHNGAASVGCLPNQQTNEDFSGAPLAERVYVTNNTFYLENYGVVGGANTIVLNNIFTGLRASALRRVGGASIAAYNLFWHNTLDYEDSVYDPSTTLSVDPLIYDDYRLWPGSPAIDAGTSSYTWNGEQVLTIPASDYAGTAPDLGAQEYTGAPPNRAPGVSAGPDLSVVLPAGATLDGTATDDGLPSGTLTSQWTTLSGPGTVAFANPAAVDTTATFSTAGTYVVELTVSDGDLSASDTAQIVVAPAPPPGSSTLDRRIAASTDDVEESATGSYSASSTDLELVYDGSNQKVGLRFPNLTVPAGAAITNAYVQFETDETQSEATNLTIRAQAADNAAAFTSATKPSTRTLGTAAASWAPAPWTLVSEAGANQRTPDLSAVVQGVVSRPGWTSGNALALIVTGTGHRTARAYDGKPTGAPLLHLEYTTGGPPPNRAPVVDAGPDQAITLPSTASLTGTATDDGPITTQWSQVSGPGSVAFGNPAATSTTASFSAAGTYVLQFAASDGQLTTTDTMQVVVQPAPVPGSATLDRRIAAGSDDVEESATGSYYATSSDLELVYDGSNQKVGLRFPNLTVPAGATITNAYVQFEADETQGEATSLTIQAQATDNAAAFTSATKPSTRSLGTAATSWTPAPWTLVGEAGANQRTPDLSAVVQEIVRRPGWTSGNALALVITGTGHRTTRAYDGKPAAAPLLHLEYTTG